MQAITRRIRFVMQAILVAALLLILPVSSEQPDILALATRSADRIAQLRPCWSAVLGEFPHAPMDQEIRAYWLGLVSEDSPTSPEERATIVSGWQVKELTVFRSYLTLRITENFVDVACPVGNDEIDALYESLTTLDRSYRETQLGSQATVAELAEATRDRVQIPIIDEAVYTEQAVQALGTGILALLVYLVSLLGALRAAIERKFEEGAMDWIFFHPGFLGVALGALWLFFPAAILLVAIIRQAVGPLTGLGYLAGLAGLAGWATQQSMAARKAVQRQLGP